MWENPDQAKRISAQSLVLQPELLQAQSGSKIKKLWQSNHEPILIWLVWRLVLACLPIVAFLLWANQASLHDTNVPISNQYWLDWSLGSWARWDGFLYRVIALHGYWDNALPAFYPLYPHLMRGLAFILAAGHVNNVTLSLAGVIIASLAALATVLVLWDLARLDYDAETARLSVIYLLAFPMAFFLLAVYTESLFLALTLAAFDAARRNRWWLAMLLTSLAVLTKNQGVLVVVALAVEYGQQINWKPSKIKAELLTFALPILALLGWLAYNALAFHSPLQFLTANQQYWHRYLAWPWQTLAKALQLFFQNWSPDKLLNLNSNFIEVPLTFGLLGLAGVGAWAVRSGKLRLSYLIFYLGCLLQPLVSPSLVRPLYSMPRFGLIIFPAFLLLALAGRRWRFFHYAYLAICLPLLIGETMAFSLGYWVS